MRFEAARGSASGEQRIPYRGDVERRVPYREEAERPIPVRAEGRGRPGAPAFLATVTARIERSPLLALGIAVVVGFAIGFVLRTRVD